MKNERSGDGSVELRQSFGAGDILVWRVLGTTSASAIERAEQMSALAQAASLGVVSITPIGIGDGAVYLDLVLSRDAEPLLIKLLFGLAPAAY